MGCGKCRRWWLIPLGLTLLPLVLWFLIVIAAPTSWARHRFASALQASTGRSVQVDRLSVCLLGGLTMNNLEIGAPGTLGDPWLRAREVTLDLSPWSVLRGCLRPRNMEVYDATLRVLRRPDGTLELSDLVRPANSSKERSPDQSDCCALGTCLTGAHQLKVGIHRAIVHVVDQLNGSSFEISGVEGEATLEGKSGGCLAITGLVNNGSFQLSGRFDRTLREPSFDIEVEAREVDLTEDAHGLRYLIPVLAGERIKIQGKVTGHASLQGRGSEIATISKSLRGRGNLTLNPIHLEGSSILDAITKIGEIPPTSITESIRSQFRIEDQRITTNPATIQIGAIPIKLTGWTDFKGNLEYKLNLESMTNRIPDKAIRLLREIDVDVDRIGIVQMSGTVDRLVVRLDGELLKPDTTGHPGRPGDDRERLRELGRRVLDRIVR